ncbi:hypothetical protein AB0I22_03600 [Streptomyces sp. NPDC050610]|uniref:hypothetical protein n=1 Tax=Streptomyces sp. NPDC050610 TaxID=3157097 RepID=UPI0034401E6D
MHSRTTARTARLRTLRIAAVALTAAAGLSLTACSGSDDGGTKAASQTEMNKAAESGNAGSTGAKDADAKSGPKSGSGSETGPKPGSADERPDSAPAPDGNGNGNGTGTGATVSKQPLADGSVAHVYKTGDQNYRAKLIGHGDVLATIETNDADAGLDANDMFVELGMDGKVHSWLGGGHQGPGTFKLAGGWTAKVSKVGELHFRAQIIGRGGEVVDTLETSDRHDVGMNANGVYIVLSNGGIISAHQ